MPKYIVPIDAWVKIDAENAETAWRQAITYLSSSIGDTLEDFGSDSGVSFGEPEESEDENE